MMRFAAALCILPLLPACAIKPVQFASTAARTCSGISYRLGIDPPVKLGVVDDSGGQASDPLGDAILKAYQTPSADSPPHKGGAVPDEPISDSMLFLSGGSQNGAFGAGLLHGWAHNRAGGLPRFRVVTGISTGSLQATFAFLDDTEEIVRRYSISREREVLQPFVTSGLDEGGWLGKLSAGRAIVKKGAIASLQPLRGQLRELISEERLGRVASEADAGRRLLVGTVELDSGDAIVFDLTKAAQAYVRTRDPDYRDCYVEALIASSSVPIAALPVFIDGEMFIDGGARFGVISDKIGATFARAVAQLDARDAKNLFVIVNGSLESGSLCDLQECGETPADNAAAISAGDAPVHAPWRFHDMAFRSVGILINQSYRSSVYWTTEEARKRGYTPYFARILDDSAAHEAEVNLPPDPDQEHSCARWREIDKEVDSPLEFHPRYMRCLIDYGLKRPEAKAWAKVE